MPTRPSKKRKSFDPIELARKIVDQATGEAPKEEAEQPAKNPAAVALGKLGGSKGGKARAAKLTAEERKAIAKKAAQSRWRKGGQSS